jgi:PD-(D/E)XK endonuclease
MKNRKNLGCRIKGTKERGAWAELYFMVMAMSQGLSVSSPYGGLGPYDVGVEDGTGPILRVQVKCTLYQCRAGCYCMSINVKDGSTGRRRGYAPGTVDFFAIYIIPTDDWYILPYAVVGDRDANVYFRPGFKGQKYGQYREGWDLLLEAAKGRGKKGLDIRACCDERAAQNVEEVMPVSAIRKMFRPLFQE